MRIRRTSSARTMIASRGSRLSMIQITCSISCLPLRLRWLLSLTREERIRFYEFVRHKCQVAKTAILLNPNTVNRVSVHVFERELCTNCVPSLLSYMSRNTKASKYRRVSSKYQQFALFISSRAMLSRSIHSHTATATTATNEIKAHLHEANEVPAPMTPGA
jgi:hypothetical protein